MFFSRNSNDVTGIYGPKLTGYIKDNLRCQAAILDGEIVVWDNNRKMYAPFGMNK